MKKILYLIPLLILIFVPKNVFAENYYQRLVYKSSGLTDEQKQEYLNTVLESETFISYSKEYPYYVIVYQEKGSYPFVTNYKNFIDIVFFNSIPIFTNTVSSVSPELYINNTNYSKVLSYSLSSLSFSEDSSIGNLKLLNFTEQIQDSNGDYISYYDYNIDYILSANFSYSLGVDKDIYDSNGNIIQTITAEQNIFEGLKIETNLNYGIEDIENADNTIYNLSKELLGDLPEEFQFLYSLVALGIGIVLVLVVLSPIIIVLRLGR